MPKAKPEVGPYEAVRRVIQSGKKSGLSVRQIAEKSGVSKDFVWRLMKGERTEAIDRFIAVAEALGLDVTVR